MTQINYDNYRFSSANYKEVGSRKNREVEALLNDGIESDADRVAAIVKDLSGGKISINEALNQLQNLGINPNISDNDNNTTIEFQYDNKNFKISVVKNKTFEETKNDYDADYIIDIYEGSTSNRYTNDLKQSGLVDDLVVFVREVKDLPEASVLKNAIGSNSVENLVKNLWQEVPVNDYMTTGDFVEAFRDKLYDLVKSNPSKITELAQKTPVDTKAEEEAKAKAEEEAKARAEEEAKAKAEEEAKEKAEEEAKAKAEEEAKAQAEAEAKAKAEQEAKAKAEQEAKAKAGSTSAVREENNNTKSVKEQVRDFVNAHRGSAINSNDLNELKNIVKGSKEYSISETTNNNYGKSFTFVTFEALDENGDTDEELGHWVIGDSSMANEYDTRKANSKELDNWISSVDWSQFDWSQYSEGEKRQKIGEYKDTLRDVAKNCSDDRNKMMQAVQEKLEELINSNNSANNPFAATRGYENGMDVRRATGGNGEESWTKKIIKGQDGTITNEYYDNNNVLRKSERILPNGETYINTYNESGKREQRTHNTVTDGHISSTSTVFFDDQGNYSSSVEKLYDANGCIAKEEIIENNITIEKLYDTNGNIKLTIETEQQSNNVTVIKKYGSDGRGEITYIKDGKVHSRVPYNADNNKQNGDEASTTIYPEGEYGLGADPEDEQTTEQTDNTDGDIKTESNKSISNDNNNKKPEDVIPDCIKELYFELYGNDIEFKYYCDDGYTFYDIINVYKKDEKLPHIEMRDNLIICYLTITNTNEYKTIRYSYDINTGNTEKDENFMVDLFYKDVVKYFQSDPSNNESETIFENGINDFNKYFSQMDTEQKIEFLTNLCHENGCFNEEYNEILPKLMSTTLEDYGYTDLANLCENIEQLETQQVIDIINIAQTRHKEEQRNNDVTLSKDGEAFSDNIKQNAMGDCWLLAFGISSADESAQEFNPDMYKYNIIKDLFVIEDEGDGTYSVTFMGETRYYDEETVNNAAELSSGDFETRLVELRTRDYVIEHPEQTNRDENPMLKGNFMTAFVNMMTGLFDIKSSDVIQQFPSDNNIDDIIYHINTGSYVTTCGVRSANSDWVDCSAKDSETGEDVMIKTHHAYAVVRADEEYIYIKNPWDSKKTIKVPVEEYKKHFHQESIEKSTLIDAYRSRLGIDISQEQGAVVIGHKGGTPETVDITDENGEVIGQKILKYRTNIYGEKILISETIIEKNKNGEIRTTKEFSYGYDKQGKIVMVKEDITVKNESGEEIESVSKEYKCNDNGEKTLVSEQRYDSTNLISSLEYDIFGRTTMTEYTYDENGNKISTYETVKDADGKIIQRREERDDGSFEMYYIYDSDGNFVESVTIENDLENDTTMIITDKYGNTRYGTSDDIDNFYRYGNLEQESSDNDDEEQETINPTEGFGLGANPEDEQTTTQTDKEDDKNIENENHNSGQKTYDNGRGATIIEKYDENGNVIEKLVGWYDSNGQYHEETQDKYAEIVSEGECKTYTELMGKYNTLHNELTYWVDCDGNTRVGSKSARDTYLKYNYDRVNEDGSTESSRLENDVVTVTTTTQDGYMRVDEYEPGPYSYSLTTFISSTEYDPEGNVFHYDIDGYIVSAEIWDLDHKNKITINPADFKIVGGLSDRYDNIDHEKVVAFCLENNLAYTYTGDNASLAFELLLRARKNSDKFKEYYELLKDGTLNQFCIYAQQQMEILKQEIHENEVLNYTTLTEDGHTVIIDSAFGVVTGGYCPDGSWSAIAGTGWGVMDSVIGVGMRGGEGGMLTGGSGEFIYDGQRNIAGSTTYPAGYQCGGASKPQTVDMYEVYEKLLEEYLKQNNAEESVATE